MKHGGKWLSSVSDMMSGLMTMFLFIAIAYMLQVQKEKADLEQQRRAAETSKRDAENSQAKMRKYQEQLEEQARYALTRSQEAEKRARNAESESKDAKTEIVEERRKGEVVREITATFSEVQTRLYGALLEEFSADLPRWNAELERDSTIRFNEPNVLFEPGKAEIQPRFAEILDDFFPRYARILHAEAFRDEIDEVRIEGHTSSEWIGALTLEDRYLLNMRLSQDRALGVATYCFCLMEIGPERDWLIKTLRANGLSFARPVFKPTKEEDQDRSRRVEFRVFTKTKEKMLRIIEATTTASSRNE